MEELAAGSRRQQQDHHLHLQHQQQQPAFATAESAGASNRDVKPLTKVGLHHDSSNVRKSFACQVFCFICSEFQDIFDVDCAIASLRGDLKAERIDSILPVRFHQCRWGYHNLSVVEDVVENYRSAQIPLDVIWNYNDHMDARKDFTLSPMNYRAPSCWSSSTCCSSLIRDLLVQEASNVFSHLLRLDPDFDFAVVVGPVLETIRAALAKWVEVHVEDLVTTLAPEGDGASSGDDVSF
ncbi:alpha-glucosidase [Hordeum vulgare]|nr:alpha-glucosidase [Hordeum vulgare]